MPGAFGVTATFHIVVTTPRSALWVSHFLGQRLHYLSQTLGQSSSSTSASRRGLTLFSMRRSASSSSETTLRADARLNFPASASIWSEQSTLVTGVAALDVF